LTRPHSCFQYERDLQRQEQARERERKLEEERLAHQQAQQQSQLQMQMKKVDELSRPKIRETPLTQRKRFLVIFFILIVEETVFYIHYP